MIVREHYLRHACGLRRAAVHEAGHAAMAIIIGGRLDRVSVRERVDDGEVVEAGRAHAWGRTASSNLLVLVAGAAAEQAWFRDGTRPEGDDLDEVRKVLSEQGVRLFSRVASSLLRLHWAGFVAIVEALEEHGALTGRAARASFYAGLTRTVGGKKV